MNEPPVDELDALKRQVVRYWAYEQEARKSAHGLKDLVDRRYYLQQAEYYKQRAAELALELETRLSGGG